MISPRRFWVIIPRDSEQKIKLGHGVSQQGV